MLPNLMLNKPAEKQSEKKFCIQNHLEMFMIILYSGLLYKTKDTTYQLVALLEIIII